MRGFDVEAFLVVLFIVFCTIILVMTWGVG